MKDIKRILEFEPVQKFIKTTGSDIEKYFGKDPACIVYLQPNGIFYATGLFEWLKSKKKDVLLTHMGDEGLGLETGKIKGRKALIVDGEIITGKAYKRSMEALRLQKEALSIKDIKYAVYIDRAKLADFFVWDYSSEATWHPIELDAVDLKIVSLLKKDGRMSFSEIGEKLHMSGVAIKNRVEWLLEKKIIDIQGTLWMDKFYAMSAAIKVDAEQKTISNLVEKLEKAPEVYHLVRRTGDYNLAVGVLARNLEDIDSFVEKEIRPLPGIRSIGIFVGDLPILPKTFSPRV